MKYVVKVEETLVRHFIVEAENESEAERTLQEAYDNGWITLDYDDFYGESVECECIAEPRHIELYDEWEDE